MISSALSGKLASAQDAMLSGVAALLAWIACSGDSSLSPTILYRSRQRSLRRIACDSRRADGAVRRVASEHDDSTADQGLGSAQSP
jgi:hypothetical protein